MNFFGEGGLFGSTQKEQMSTSTPDQQQLISQLLQQLGAPTGAGIENLMGILSGEEGAFDAFEAPIKRQFEEETIPQLGEQFAGAGALSSSAFGQQLGRAGENLSATLGSQRAGLQQNAMQQLMQLLGISQKPQFENVVTQQPGAVGDIGKIMASIAMMTQGG